MSLKVGLIGLGPMGGNIAGNLLKKQFAVAGYDLIQANIDALDDLGLDASSSVADVAEKADVLISSLPSYGALQSVIADLEAVSKPGQVLIECSTLQVDQKIEAAGKLKEGGRIMLDSPISATPPMLAKGMASIHVSGEKEAFEKCLSIFEGFTASNFYVGKVGNGSRMKILANYLVHVHTTAAAESKMMESRGKFMADSDYREGGGTMFAIFEKDASIITEFAAQVHAPIDLYVSARQKMNSTIALGYGHLDTSAVCKGIEVAVGIDRDIVED
jgi:putative dehydrogenase